jgi:cell division protein FtsB
MENPINYKSNKKQYDKLQGELNKLEQNMKKLEGNMKITLEQIPSIRQLGTSHSSLYVFELHFIIQNANAIL